MRRVSLLAIACALVWAQPASAAFTVSSSVKSSTVGMDQTITAAADTTGADLLVYVVSWYRVGSVPTITDSKTNTTATNRTTYDSASFSTMIRISYVLPNNVGTGHTFTASCTGCYPALIVLVVDNDPSASFDTGNESGAESISTTAVPGSLTPSTAGCLVVTGLGSLTDSPSAAVDSPFTAVSRIAYADGMNVALDVGYSIQTTAVAANPTWSNTTVSMSNMAVFTPTGPGPAGDASSRGGMLMGVGE